MGGRVMTSYRSKVMATPLRLLYLVLTSSLLLPLTASTHHTHGHEHNTHNASVSGRNSEDLEEDKSLKSPDIVSALRFFDEDSRMFPSNHRDNWIKPCIKPRHGMSCPKDVLTVLLSGVHTSGRSQLMVCQTPASKTSSSSSSSSSPSLHSSSTSSSRPSSSFSSSVSSSVDDSKDPKLKPPSIVGMKYHDVTTSETQDGCDVKSRWSDNIRRSVDDVEACPNNDVIGDHTDDVMASREVISYQNSIPLPDYKLDLYLDLHLHFDAYVEFHAPCSDEATDRPATDFLVEIKDTVYTKDNSVRPQYKVNTWVTPLGSKWRIILQMGTLGQAMTDLNTKTFQLGTFISWAPTQSLTGLTVFLAGVLAMIGWLVFKPRGNTPSATFCGTNEATDQGNCHQSRRPYKRASLLDTDHRIQQDTYSNSDINQSQVQVGSMQDGSGTFSRQNWRQVVTTDTDSQEQKTIQDSTTTRQPSKSYSQNGDGDVPVDYTRYDDVIVTSLGRQEENSVRSSSHRSHVTSLMKRQQALLKTMEYTTQSENNDLEHKGQAKVTTTSPSSLTTTPKLSIKLSKPRLRLAAFLSFGFVLFVTVAVGVSRIKNKPTVHITFPAKLDYRHVRMFSDFPDLTLLSKNYTSLTLVSRLQLLDAQRCRNDPEACKISVVCDKATGQEVNCRCRTGFYFNNWKCRECSSTCPRHYYLASSCSSDKNAVCKPCTICGSSQYVAAPCNTKRDTICIDVSFPAGFLPMNRSHLPDDGIQVYVSHSSNVFVERLIDQERLENSMYVTNNQQVMEFVWDRMSSLSVSISVSGVFLVPEYHDVDAVDDTELFRNLNDATQLASDFYAHVQNSYCRHPVPDYYSLQLEIDRDRTAAAKVVRCDSQDARVAPCPPGYKDGDRFLDWNINTPCPMDNRQSKLARLVDGYNSVVCKDETPMLRRIFQKLRPTTQEYMYPSVDCQRQRMACRECLRSATCPTANTTRGMFGDESQCCGISCFTSPACKKAYSKQCPKPHVECASGEVNIFSLFPKFHSMEHQFSCHLRYQPPEYLYRLNYVIHIPSLNYNSSGTSKIISLRSRKDHQRKLSRFDFLQSLHDTGMPVEDEILLVGDRRELRPYGQSHMKPYTIRRFKTREEFNERQTFQYDAHAQTAYIQLERPFQYSSYTWYKDGCYKNMSRIFPNQTIHSSVFLPVEAKIGYQPNRPGMGPTKHPGFAYQMYRRKKQPFVKLSIGEAESILKHLQGRDVKGNLIANSLHGEVTWHYETATWRIILTGEQDLCPSVVSIKIFTQLMTGCAGHFDVFINCPAQFTVTFNLSTAMSDLPDIFVVQINDSSTSHRMVLSSVYAPLSVEESRSEGSHLVREEKLTSAENHHDQNFNTIWQPLLVVVIFSLSVLLLLVTAYQCINVNARRVVLSGAAVENETEKVALNNHNENHARVPAVSIHKPKTQWFVYLFSVLYIFYCLIFSFSLTAGIIYLTYKSSVAEYSQPKHSGNELELQVNMSVLEIEKFENSERLRLFKAFEGRRQACMAHLEKENKKLLQDYQETTGRQVSDVFTENGTIHRLTNDIQRQNVSMYMTQVSQFLSDCNKTIHSIIDRFQSNYFEFLKKSVMNDWLKVPRQIFLVQDGEDPDRKYLSSTQIKQFAAWLEVDKVGALLAARENMVHRLDQVSIPSVSSVDMTFPAVTPDLSSAIPEFQPDPHVYTMIVLGSNVKSSNGSSRSSSSGGGTSHSRNKRVRRDAPVKREDRQGFGLSGNVEPSSDFNNSSYSNDGGNDSRTYASRDGETKGYFSHSDVDDDRDVDVDVDDGEDNDDDAIVEDFDEDEEEEEVVEDTDDDVSIERDADDDNVDNEESAMDESAPYSVNDYSSQGSNLFDSAGIKTQVDSIMIHDSSQNLIDDTESAKSAPLAMKSSSSSPSSSPSSSDSNTKRSSKDEDGSDDEDDGYFYILIGMFITLDAVLWLYRFSWLSNQLYAAKHGYADRIPTDDACKQVLEIQTAYHLPAFNGSLENTGTYVDGKEPLYGTEKDRDHMTFLQPLPNTKNDDILQQIWKEKTIQSEDRWDQRFFLTRWFEKFKEVAQRFFLSQLVWQACVTFLAIIFIAITLYAIEFWLVPANLRTLVGSQSATSDIQWQLDTSGRYLHALARQLTYQLARIRQLCDMEVAVLTEAFFSTINTQTSAFTRSLQRLCVESKGKNCDQLSVFKPTGGRIVGCNFLPLQAQTIHDLSLSNIEELVSGEITPFLHLSKKVISTSSLVIVTMLCLRFLCQVAATTVRHYLLLTGKLPRVKVYQSEEPSQMLRGAVPGGSSSAMQRSQSWVDSCESGVYVGEVEEAGNPHTPQIMAAANHAMGKEDGAKIISINS